MGNEVVERLQKTFESRQSNGSGNRIVDVLTEALEMDVEQMSRAEIAYVLGIQEDHTGKLIRQAVRSGVVEFKGKQPVANIIGSVTQVPFYGLANVSCNESDS